MDFKLAFHPRIHGFHFDNQFANHVMAFGVQLFTTHGLCGGMSATVLDYPQA